MTDDGRPPITPEALLAHQSALRRLAQHLLRDSHAADDVVQDTWTAALRTPPRQGVPLGAWLRTVARNFARRRQRTVARRQAREQAVARSESAPAAAEAIERVELQRRVAQAVLELDEPFRSAVVLRYFEGLSPKDIAVRTRVPAATARTRVKRGLDRLRARLDAGPEGKNTLALLAGASIVGTKTKLALAAAAVVAVLLFAFRRDGVPDSPRTAERDGVSTEAASSVPGADATSAPGGSLWLTGRVLLPWGAGAEGATVFLLRRIARDPQRTTLRLSEIPRDPAPALGTTTARADGAFVLEGAPPAGAGIVLGASAPGYAPRILDGVDLRRQRSGLVIRLRPTWRTIPGIVVAEDGDALAGARIRPLLDTAEAPGEELRSDADGRFEVAVAPDVRGRRLLVQHPDHLPAIASVSAGMREARVVLRRGGPVHGSVADAAGRPAPGARVLLSAAWVEHETRTGEDGTFRFERVAPTPWNSGGGWRPTFQLRVDGGARGQAVIPRVPWTPDAELRVVLQRSVQRRGRVLDAQGRGVPDVRVVVHETNGRLAQTVVSDADGRFVLAGASADYTSCNFEHPEYALAPPSATGQPAWAVHAFLESDPGAADDEREFLLWKKGIVRGRVVDAPGKPVPDALVWPGHPRRRRALAGPGRGAQVLTDAEGRFELRVSNWTWDQVVRARTHRHGTVASEAFRAPRGKALELRLELPEPTRFAGTVHDEAGQPLALARVALLDTPQETFTAKDGSFAIDGAPAGAFGFSVSAPGFLRQDVAGGAGAGPAHVVLRRSIVFRARLLDARGDPLADIAVHRGTPRGMRHDDGERYSRTDSDGVFEFRGCGPGEFVIGGPGYVIAPKKFAVPFDGVFEFRARRSVATPMTITGRVLDEAGAALPLAERASVSAIDAAGKTRASAQCDLAGRFEIRGLPEGQYLLKASSPGRLYAPVQEIAAGAGDVVVRATPPVTISGRVVAEDGDAVRGALIKAVADPTPDFAGLPKAQGAGNAWSGPSAVTDAAGQFTIRGALANTSTVVVLHRRYAVGWKNGVAKGAHDLELHLERGASLSGRIEPQEIAASVRIRTTDECGIRRTTRPAANGKFTVHGLAGQRVKIEAWSNRPNPRVASTEFDAGRTDVVLKLRKATPEELRKLTSRAYGR